MPLTSNTLFRSSDAKLSPVFNRLHKIRIYRNGDASYRGHLFKFRKSNYRSFSSLLATITAEMQEKIFIHIGGIRGLFHMDGTEIRSVDQLTDGECYVATCLSEPFKADTLYPLVSRTCLSRTSSTLIGTKSLTSLRRRPLSLNSRTSVDYHTPVEKLFKPRTICVVQGEAERPRPTVRIHLNHTNATRLQTVLERINQQLYARQEHDLDKVFMENCVEVKCVDDFFGACFVFLAFPKIDLEWGMFEMDEDEDEVISEFTGMPTDNDRLVKHLPLAIRAQYKVKEKLASGGFTSVHECVERATNALFVLKLAKKSKECQFAECYIRQMKNEMALLPDLRHPNIVRIFLTEETNEAVYTVIEHLDGGELRKAITNAEILPEEYIPLIDNLVSALAYLHLRGIAHRDVCPTNMMLRSHAVRRQLVLTDFNHAVHVTEPLYDYCGFLLYMAPEMLMRRGYGLKADIWAAGVTLYFMVTKQLPFTGNFVDKCTRRILRRSVEYNDLQWDGVPDSTKVLTDLMLSRDPTHRLSAGECLAFIANIRDGHYNETEFQNYCDIEIPNQCRSRSAGPVMGCRS